MNFVISSTGLLNRLQIVSRVVGSKNTLAILNNFLFSVKDNQLTITGSDLESTLSAKIELDSSNGEGDITIDAVRLVNIVKEFPEQPLTFSVNQETFQIDINSENGKFVLMGQNAEDFPQIPTLKADSVVRTEIEPDVLLSGVSSTIFATGNDELRPVMCGVFIEMSKEKGLGFVATDAHKLVRYRRKDVEISNDASFILPKKPAGILKSILPKADDNIILEFDDKNAFINFGDFKLVCRLVEGKYPNYEGVIPVNSPYKLELDRLEFHNTLKRVSIFSNQASNQVKLHITANQLTISAQDLDFSISGYETINCNYDGDELDISFKSLFLMELLNNITTPEVILQLASAATAGIIYPKDNELDDEDILMILMPMMMN